VTRHGDRPWLAAIPPADVESFSAGYGAFERPISHGSRPALLIVDMTREFVDSAYPTGFSETGVPAVRSAARLLAAARSAAVPVYFSKGFPDPEHVPVRGEAGRWKGRGTSTKVPGLPPGDVIVDELQPRPDEIVIHKRYKPSAFFGTPLASLLIADGIDTLVVAGMTTSGCVRAAVVDAFQLNLHVVVAQEACADRSQISHAVSLFDIHMRWADVVGEHDAVAVLQSGP
jgi:nicotinamidase-related amidase